MGERFAGRMTPPRHRRRGPRSLGGKLVWILTLVGLTGAVAIAMLLAAIITPGFDRLEERGAALRRDRVQAAIAAIVDAAETTARDIAEGKAAAEAGDDVVLLSPGAPPVPRTAGVDRAVARMAGRLDPAALLQGGQSAGFYARIDGRLTAIGLARTRADTGVVLLARRIDPAVLSARAGREVAIRFAPAGPSDDRTVALPMAGADGRPVAEAVFPLHRDLTRLGRRTLWAAIGGTVLLLAAMLLVLRRSISHLVLGPLARIERHLQAVRSSGAVTMLDHDRRQDEIGSLTASLNAMLRRLHDMAGQSELQSFRLGRSESRAAVMHNVRNALSPISAILSQGLAQPPVAERATIERAVAELGRDDLPADRRAKLVEFVMAAIDAAARARVDRLAQLDIGRTALGNVLDIVGQQPDAGDTDIGLARCDATDLIARNGTIARVDGGRPSIACSFPAQPCWVRANRVILGQVIGNLFRNAVEAIVARGGDSGQVIVTIQRGDAAAAITIADDGEGFDPAEASRLFQRDYSTRTGKSGGLGLHWCANWVAAMGGTLRLESDGPGLGARAILTLPLADGWSGAT